MAQPWWPQLPVSSFSQEVLPGRSCGKWGGFILIVLCHSVLITLFFSLDNKPNVLCLTFQESLSPLKSFIPGNYPKFKPTCERELPPLTPLLFHPCPQM